MISPRRARLGKPMPDKIESARSFLLYIYDKEREWATKRRGEAEFAKKILEEITNTSKPAKDLIDRIYRRSIKAVKDAGR